MIRLLLMASFIFTLSRTCLPEQKPPEQRDLPSPLLCFFGDCMTGPGWLYGNRIYHRGFTCYKLEEASWPGEPISGPCALLDVDGDGDIDLADFAELQIVFDR